MEESLEAVLTSLKDEIIPDGNKFNKSKQIVTQLLATCGGDTEEDSMLIKVRFDSLLKVFWTHPWIQLPMAINVILLVNL